MKQHTTNTWMILIALCIVTFFTFDFLTGTLFVEEVIVVHKTFSPTSNRVAPVLVAFQAQPLRTYFRELDKKLFYDIAPQDRLLIRKKYGAITGFEYQAELYPEHEL